MEEYENLSSVTLRTYGTINTRQMMARRTTAYFDFPGKLPFSSRYIATMVSPTMKILPLEDVKTAMQIWVDTALINSVIPSLTRLPFALMRKKKETVIAK